jgi:hypothetical protein
MLVEFDSVEEFAKACKQAVKEPSYRRADTWTAHVSFSQAIEKSLVGDESYVDGANKLIDQLDVDMPTTKAFKRVHSPYGGSVNMGDWLAASPTPMRRRIRTSSDIGPVNIYVSTTSSAGVDAETMKKRGYAILALLLKLQTVRPIQLYLLTELHGARDGWHYQKIRVESQPLNISVAAFALCNVGWARHLTYDYAREIDGFNGCWPKGYDSPGYVEARRERLGLADNDLLIKKAHVQDELVKRPLEWLTKQLEKYANIND